MKNRRGEYLYFCSAEQDSLYALTLFREKEKQGTLNVQETGLLLCMEQRAEDSWIYLMPAAVYAAANQKGARSWMNRQKQEKIDLWNEKGIAWMRRYPVFLEQFGWKQRRYAILAAGIFEQLEEESMDEFEKGKNQVCHFLQGSWGFLWKRMQQCDRLSVQEWKEMKAPWKDSVRMDCAMSGILLLMAQLLKKELEETEALYEIGAASQSEADNLKFSVNKAKIQLESAQKQLELNKGSILEDTKKSLQVNITQAEASLASAQKQLDDTKVRVEIDGIIGTLNISEGSVVNAQGEAMTLVNMDNLKVSFHVSEDVINEISVGSPVYITVSAVSDDPMTATVTNISEVADSSTRLYQVEAALSNTEGNLKPGMFANVRLVTETKEDTIVVPLNTVLTDNGEKYVFVVDENNIAHKTVVETGLENDTYIEITSGLNIGDTVVTKGQDFLSDGNTVNITNGTTEQESIAEVPEQE